jgi:hypothetical protein
MHAYSFSGGGMSFLRKLTGASSANKAEVSVDVAAKKSPQEIYAALDALHTDKASKNSNLFRRNRDLEVRRNYFLQDALVQMKDKVEDTEENYNNCKDAIIKLLRTDINCTTKWLSDKKMQLEGGKDLGKIYRSCIALMPEAFIELLWRQQLQPDDRKDVIMVYTHLRDELKGKELKYALPAATKEFIQSNPMFKALSVDVIDLRQQILETIFNLDTRFANNQLGMAPVNDKNVLNRLLIVLDDWIQKKEWDAPAYEKIKADLQVIHPPLYKGTADFVKKITAYADVVPAISAINIAINKKPDAVRPVGS